MGRSMIQAGRNRRSNLSGWHSSSPRAAELPSAVNRERWKWRLQTIGHTGVLKSCYLLHDDKYRKIIKCKEFLNEQIFNKCLLCAFFQVLHSDDQEIRFQLSWRKRHHKEINTINSVMFYSVRSAMTTKWYCESKWLVDCFDWVNLP